MNYLVIFFVSFTCVLLELFWTRILNLKTWNHVVYTVIPFAILGCGIGANLQMILSRRLRNMEARKLCGALLLVTGLVMATSTWAIIRLPIRVEHLVNLFTSLRAAGTLSAAYAVFMLPFVAIGFVVVYLFATFPKDTHKLYCVDLIGAAVGAGCFFVLINEWAVVRSLLVLSVLVSCLGACCLMKSRGRWAAVGVSVVAMVVTLRSPEPSEYAVDPQKGWEWIPGFFDPLAYDWISSRWHPLGRTDIYRINDSFLRSQMANSSSGTFQINVSPTPEFVYFSSNFLSGAPVYRFRDVGKDGRYTVKPFLCAVEIPYVLTTVPRTMIIGVGGGRDVFIARTHHAREIVGAEINPAIVQAMSPGGVLYEYSGRIYDAATIACVDGRHLVKTASGGHFDLVVLNGADTFSGLSSGAYAYAESYLYTKEAVVDYLRILNDRGLIHFNRPPSEASLRLLAIALEALRENGAPEPWKHVLVGTQGGWSMTLVKKTPFADEEVAKAATYLHDRGATLVYPSSAGPQRMARDPSNDFEAYVDAFKEGKERIFARQYPYDISVITDNSPFFYKCYKFHWKDLLHPEALHHTGTIIYWTQFLVLAQALLFSVLFVVLPLVLSKETSIRHLPHRRVVPLVAYFACLGVGYMFIEIPLMQKFVLLLGSPIYSISIVLAGLLFWTGMGSFILPRFRTFFADDWRALFAAAAGVVALLLITITAGEKVQEFAMGWPFLLRAVFVAGWLAPTGIFLGFFFPLGLRAVGAAGQAAVAWAWGINCGFSVLGSMLAISIAQSIGFNTVILMAAIAYVLAAMAFRWIATSSTQNGFPGEWSATANDKRVLP